MEAQRIQDNGDINRRIGDSYEEEPFSPETEEHWRQVVLRESNHARHLPFRAKSYMVTSMNYVDILPILTCIRGVWHRHGR